MMIICHLSSRELLLRFISLFVSEIFMIGVCAHSLLSSRVLHNSFNLMGCNIPYAEVSISEVGAQLLGLHSWPPGQPAAEPLVDVAVGALPALLAELADPRGRLAAGVVHTDVAGLAVGVLVAVLPGLLAEDRQTAS